NNGSSEQDQAGKPELISHVKYLDNMLPENSGLILYDSKLWSINDSGGDPVLFSLDIQTGKVLQAIMVENGSNRDWESLAQDEKYIYICDVGNNQGRRETLKIYKLAKDSIPSSGNAVVTADIIRYRYKGRGKNNPMKRSAYDCEAVFAFADSLYLFTKNWETRSTTLYTCSCDPGEYELQPRRTYPVDGLVTGVDISPDSSFIMFCGYKDYVPFVWIVNDFDPVDYSHGKTFRFDYPALIDLQTEGIAVFSPERVYISCEMTEFPAALYRIDPGPWLK
ncbi:MAG: hypothetical protein KAT15_25700, partial [Bacteroidales bacterium]|nr:hypothetical protein [Bacteroidales bacterium]